MTEGLLPFDCEQLTSDLISATTMELTKGQYSQHFCFTRSPRSSEGVEMLLTIEALLIFAALLQDHRAAVEGQLYQLDMALNSVDDQYDGCTVNMSDLVKKKYLEKELSNSATFKNAWQDAEMYYKHYKPVDYLTKNQLMATYVYTNGALHIHRDFNNAVRNGKQNYTEMTFRWYSLHFLLTEAIQILNKHLNRCFDTYRGTKVKFNENVLNTTVRFGQFTSSSLDPKVTKEFGNVSCFEISTCYGAEVSKLPVYPEEEVLIPPYEMFNVRAVKSRIVEKDLWCDTVFKLESAGIKSNFNCALFK